MTCGSVEIEPAGQISVGNRLGEGIVWDELSGAFLWTDIHERCFFRLYWPSLHLDRFDLPFRLGSFALTGCPSTVLAAFEQGFAWYDFETRRCDWICRPPIPPGVRFNDGRVDRVGRFLAGTMVEDPRLAGGDKAGALYRLEMSGEANVLIDRIGITNSLCWSPDGAIMYHADSTEGVLNAYDYVEGPGQPWKLVTPSPPAVPDGATVDAEGRIWVALWGGTRVATYSPVGETICEVSLPVSQPTCVALGGHELDVLAITSAHDGLSQADRARETAAGDLFLFRTTARGLEECRVAM